MTDIAIFEITKVHPSFKHNKGTLFVNDTIYASFQFDKIKPALVSDSIIGLELFRNDSYVGLVSMLDIHTIIDHTKKCSIPPNHYLYLHKTA